MENFDFVAVDFETVLTAGLTHPSFFICQVGIAAVKDGKISQKVSHYIQPPNNEYDTYSQRVHKITPEMTSNSSSWDELWPDLEVFFKCKKIVAHNASFDNKVLKSVQSHYSLPEIPASRFICTCNLFRNKSLEALSLGFGFEYDKEQHHDALYDAVRSAEFYLCHLNGVSPDWDIVNNSKKAKKFNFAPAGYEKLSGDILVKNLDGANKNNPFYDKKVVVTGVFTQGRKEIGDILYKMGADIDTGITKRIDYVLIGDEPGPSKIKKLDALIESGSPIQRLYQQDLDAIIAGNWEGYYMEKE